jgi:hypothetical protein
MNKISNLFNGSLDIDNVDINSPTTFRNRKLSIANPTNTAKFTFNTLGITSNINVSLPILLSDDVFTFNSATQTLTNKTISTTNNTITDIGDSNIAAHVSSKISINKKSQLLSSDQPNTFSSANNQIFKSGLFSISNPAGTANYALVHQV